MLTGRWEGNKAPPAPVRAWIPAAGSISASFSYSLAPAAAAWLRRRGRGNQVLAAAVDGEVDSGIWVRSDQMVGAEYFSNNSDKHLGHLNGVLHDKPNTPGRPRGQARRRGEQANQRGAYLPWIKLP